MNRELLTLYGLKWNPFATDLPVESLMATPAVDSFCRRIEQHLVRQGGFALITGEPGTGKSAALRLLAGRLERTDGLRVAALAHPSSRVADFYHEMGEVFGVTLMPRNNWGGFKLLRQRWLDHLEETRLRPLLLIDEAQELLPSVFAEIRLLEEAGNPALMTAGLKNALVTHAGGNARTLTVMADALLVAGAEKNREVLDEKLFIETWGEPTRRKAARR